MKKTFVTHGKILRGGAASTAVAHDDEETKAKLAAAFLLLKRREDQMLEMSLDRTTELAVALAERLVGGALEIAQNRRHGESRAFGVERRTKNAD